MKKLYFFLLLFSISNVYAEISLSDLGVNNTPDLTPTDLKLEKTMKERTSRLKTHEMLGLATWGLMTATMFTGGSALDNNLHMYLGMATGALYFTTAYFSFSTPKPDNIQDKTRMKWHKRLAWIHLPLMILVPYMGYVYKKNEEENRKHSSLIKQHSAFAGALYGSFTLSTALMVIEF